MEIKRPSLKEVQERLGRTKGTYKFYKEMAHPQFEELKGIFLTEIGAYTLLEELLERYIAGFVDDELKTRNEASKWILEKRPDAADEIPEVFETISKKFKEQLAEIMEQNGGTIPEGREYGNMVVLPVEDDRIYFQFLFAVSKYTHKPVLGYMIEYKDKDGYNCGKTFRNSEVKNEGESVCKSIKVGK